MIVKFMSSFVHNYLKSAENYNVVRFILELTVLCFVLKIFFVILFSIIFALIGVNTGDGNVEFAKYLISEGFYVALLQTVFFASFETLTGQWLVIWIVSKWTQKNWIKILSSAVVFSLLHVEPLLVAAVFPIGLVLAWTFILKRQKSRWEAFWVTTAIHVLHNLFVLYLVWTTPS